MEEEKKEEIQIPQKKRRVSFFKRRKKPNVRPIVQQRKNRQFKEILFKILSAFGILFLLIGILFTIQQFFIPRLFFHNKLILTPQKNFSLTDSEIEKIIRASSSYITNIHFATNSATISYVLRGNTQVYLSTAKDIHQQLSLVDAIDRQVLNDGKQAIYIDLRYNKPIVKY